MSTRKRITVYQSRHVDPVTNRVILSFCKMRAEAILAIGAQVIEDTAQTVWEDDLDDEGRYYHQR